MGRTSPLLLRQLVRRRSTLITAVHDLDVSHNLSEPKPFSHYKISELDRVMVELHREWGRVVRVGGLLGHPDLLFVFDAVLVEQVHGQQWHDFRAQVQQVLLQPSVARQYVTPLNEIAADFMDRIAELRDENNELPGAFLGELYKWALESSLALISAAVTRLEQQHPRDEDKLPSLLERVLDRTGDPKVAAIMALDLLLVGIDTTSVSLASTLNLLARSPEQQERLHEELVRVLPSPDTPVTEERLNQLPFLRACTHVIFPHYVLSNSERYFVRPGEFLPERWLKGAACPAHLQPGRIFRQYQVEYHYGDIKYTIHPTYIPESPLKFRLKERH
ncbi:hypothetical protein B566_EDAN015719 [Ephemera danica]|nr:hypothetical protein B566_EDAN015719 [Ephemera danica]